MKIINMGSRFSTGAIAQNHFYQKEYNISKIRLNICALHLSVDKLRRSIVLRLYVDKYRY